MALAHSPKIVTNNLYLNYDAANIKSYPGSGTTWRDLSENARNGTLTNGPTFNSAGSNSSFTFDGIDDILETTVPITATPALGNWTYEVWARITSFPTAVSPANVYGNSYRSGVLLGATYYGGAALYWYGNSAGTAMDMYGFLRGNDAYRNTTAYSMALNTTYQFVMVNNYSGGAIQLYVNGAFYASTGSATQEYNSGLIAGLNIGIALPQVDGGGTANYSRFPGRVYAAKIYSNALSAVEVLRNYNAFRGRFST